MDSTHVTHTRPCTLVATAAALLHRLLLLLRNPAAAAAAAASPHCFLLLLLLLSQVGRLHPLLSAMRGWVSPVLIESFTLTFLAEWGDRSQIATIGGCWALLAAGLLHSGLWVLALLGWAEGKDGGQ